MEDGVEALGGGGGGVWGAAETFVCFTAPAFPLVLPDMLGEDDDDDKRVTVLLGADAKVNEHVGIPDEGIWVRRPPDRKLRELWSLEGGAGALELLLPPLLFRP